MDAETAHWLDDLPLARHAEVLHRLVSGIAAEPAFRFLELCCSVARGAGDELSDLDLGLGVDDATWPAALELVPGLLTSCGEVVGLLTHRIPEWGERPHARFFMQLADGVQVDLVAMPASTRKGIPEGSIALYDPDGRLQTEISPAATTATARDVTEWSFLAWTALADLDKYLRRGSLWEALERLHEARTFAWRLWAAGLGLPYPVFGLTTVLDARSPELPPEIDDTVPGFDAVEIRRAGRQLARILSKSERRAVERTGGAPASAMAEYVGARLADAGPD